jgi:hypothetical protein
MFHSTPRRTLILIAATLSFDVGATNVMAQTATGPGDTQTGFYSNPSGPVSNPWTYYAGISAGNVYVAAGAGNGAAAVAVGSHSNGQTNQAIVGTGLPRDACTLSLGPNVPSDC